MHPKKRSHSEVIANSPRSHPVVTPYSQRSGGYCINTVALIKELYPGIARKFDTSASKVERAMRHAIEVAWTRGRLDAVNQMYGYRVFAREDKPTNGEFIAMVSDKLTVKKTA